GRADGEPACFQTSSVIVNGPSLTSSTRIIAPNRPVATVAPRLRSAVQNASTRGSATCPGAAADQDGRRPFTVSAYNVNWLTTSNGASTSEQDFSSAR